jgi:hypothetical protein
MVIGVYTPTAFSNTVQLHCLADARDRMTVQYSVVSTVHCDTDSQQQFIQYKIYTDHDWRGSQQLTNCIANFAVSTDHDNGNDTTKVTIQSTW